MKWNNMDKLIEKIQEDIFEPASDAEIAARKKELEQKFTTLKVGQYVHITSTDYTGLGKIVRLKHRVDVLSELTVGVALSPDSGLTFSKTQIDWYGVEEITTLDKNTLIEYAQDKISAWQQKLKEWSR
jgi:hypothetical protein